MILFPRVWHFLLLELVIPVHCAPDSPNCGYSMCICYGNTAKCTNKTLSHLPNLPDNITELIFKGNLSKLSKETLEPLSKLKIKTLRILSSGLVNVTSDAFSNLPFLEELDLSGNKMISRPELADSFPSIQRNYNFSLILNQCNISTLEDGFFNGLNASKVQSITMRHNRMKDFYISSFCQLKTLLFLDLSENWIKHVNTTRTGKGCYQSNIEILKLTDNDFYLFPPILCDNTSHAESYFPNLRSLDLSNNFISVPRAVDWHCLKMLEVLYLSRNAIQILENDVFYDLSSLKTLELSYMLRKIDIIYPRAFNSTSLINLTFRNNIEVFNPDSGINIETMFNSLSKLEFLSLEHNNLSSVKEKVVHMLRPLKNLKVLILRKTQMNKIPEGLLANFQNLSTLILSGNQIERVSSNAFENVTNLNFLDLSNNNLPVIRRDSFPDALMNSLKEINLANNPFSCYICDSDDVWFRKWIDRSMERGITFQNWPEEYHCHTPAPKSGSPLKDFSPGLGCHDTNLLIAYISIGVFMLLILIFGIVGYRGRWYIRYWLIKLRWNIKRPETADPEQQTLLQEDDVVYDAYIIYHDMDFSFVGGKLLPLMEEQYHYKLFVRDREPEFFGVKVDVMVESIYKSNHVIAVVSKNFLRDQWCDFQLAVSRDRQVELKRDFVFLVALEDVEKRLLSKSWCVLFTRTPTAEWCDKKNGIKRRHFESMITTKICNRRYPRQLSRSSDPGD